MRLMHEGFSLVLPALKRYKPGHKLDYTLLTITDGEVDCMFAANNLREAKADIEKYYEFLDGTTNYAVEVYTRL